MKRKWIVLACLSLIAVTALSCSSRQVDNFLKKQIQGILEDRMQAMQMHKHYSMLVKQFCRIIF